MKTRLSIFKNRTLSVIFVFLFIACSKNDITEVDPEPLPLIIHGPQIILTPECGGFHQERTISGNGNYKIVHPKKKNTLDPNTYYSVSLTESTISIDLITPIPQGEHLTAIYLLMDEKGKRRIFWVQNEFLYGGIEAPYYDVHKNLEYYLLNNDEYWDFQ
ncbi:hypothetical protein [Bacteroides sp. 519]|uniref:hypothetical protein n=1 Tax=Bacteroides sp. 519 TaxID=2302937 RepID=UPI0013D06DB5|nr:hypothetical protein [Bacteroides sp. 519]NDV58012.1 hypothetical protein [Bacteroides sp. 519]